MEKILTNRSAVFKIYQAFPPSKFCTIYSNSSVHILPRDEYFCLEQSCMLYQEMNTLYKLPLLNKA